jgi:hypothetical protein
MQHPTRARLHVDRESQFGAWPFEHRSILAAPFGQDFSQRARRTRRRPRARLVCAWPLEWPAQCGIVLPATWPLRALLRVLRALRENQPARERRDTVGVSRLPSGRISRREHGEHGEGRELDLFVRGHLNGRRSAESSCRRHGRFARSSVFSVLSVRTSQREASRKKTRGPGSPGRVVGSICRSALTRGSRGPPSRARLRAAPRAWSGARARSR